MKDHQISIDEYLINDGFSSKRFVSHFKFFIRHKPANVDMKLYRSKVVLLNRQNNRHIVIKVHWNGRSDKYATILNRNGTIELATFHCRISPEALSVVVLGLLK